MNTTVIYLTDNSVAPNIATLCRANILKAIGDFPLISVSHEPIDFGMNICVGKLPRSSLTINIQMMKALEKVTTPFIAIAEHDCLYWPEHFLFVPPDKNFWYNENVWLLQYESIDHPESNGMFSFFPTRKANSQLIVATDQMIRSTQDRIRMMGDPAWMAKHPSGRIGEAGVMDLDHAMKLSRGASVRHIREQLRQYVEGYIGKIWRSKSPNLDIRHGNNFTKNCRGMHRRFELAPWGKMEDVFNAA